MNAYFLVEGKRCERKLYPSWIAHRLPRMTRVSQPSDATDNCYFLISGEGYPSILGEHLSNAIADVVSCGNYDQLIVVLDADEADVATRDQEVIDAASACTEKMRGTQLRVIVQNRCIETWLLGNRRVFTRTPQNPELLEFIRFYNVAEDDPEDMPVHSRFNTHSQYHTAYLKLIFRERNLSYTKRSPGHAAEGAYLDQIIARTRVSTEQLLSFLRLVAIMDEMGNEKPA